MSGRKSSEVSALLARGRQAREAGEKNFNNRLDNGVSEIEKNQKKVKEYFDKIQKEMFSVSEDCLREFPSESRELELQIESLRANKYSDKYIKHVSKAASERKEIIDKLKKADEEGDKIRESIRSKSHYCDSEYRRADILVGEYKEISKRRDKLVRETDDAVKGSVSELVRFENYADQMSGLMKKTRQLENKAKQIVELRKKADGAREYLNGAIKETDAGIAEKFMPDEYEKLKKEIEKIVHMADAEVVKELAGATESIGMFRAKLDKEYAVFMEEQRRTEAGIRHLEDLLAADGYYEPTDYMRNTDKAERIALIKYIKEYGNSDRLIKNIEKNMREIKEKFEREEFENAQALISETDKNIHQAMEYAALLQENMLKNAYTAFDIRKVMMEFGYDVTANKIDGNPKNGWNIVAYQGGETINFDRIYIDEDGIPDISIEHTTRPGASCHAEWEELTSAMDGQGINIKKIVQENGTVVVDKAGELKKAVSVSGRNNEQIHI